MKRVIKMFGDGGAETRCQRPGMERQIGARSRKESQAGKNPWTAVPVHRQEGRRERWGPEFPRALTVLHGDGGRRHASHSQHVLGKTLLCRQERSRGCWEATHLGVGEGAIL